MDDNRHDQDEYAQWVRGSTASHDLFLQNHVHKIINTRHFTTEACVQPYSNDFTLLIFDAEKQNELALYLIRDAELGDCKWPVILFV